jgi:hypothetical protein
MRLPTTETCLACGATGPFPFFGNQNDESAFEVHGRFGGLGMFKCRKCGAFNLLKFRLLFTSSFVEVIKPGDPRHKRIAAQHAELFSDTSSATEPTEPGTAQHNEPEDIAQVLQDLGKAVTLEDLIKATSAGGAAIEFATLDRATKLVFDRLVKEQAQLLLSCFPTAAAGDAKTLLMAIGGHLFVGFIVGRRLFGTHKGIVEFSGGASDLAEKAQRLETLCRNSSPQDLLDAAGHHFGGFLEEWVEIHSKVGIYADIPNRQAASELLYVTLLNGWALAVSEYQMPMAN